MLPQILFVNLTNVYGAPTLYSMLCLHLGINQKIKHSSSSQEVWIYWKRQSITIQWGKIVLHREETSNTTVSHGKVRAKDRLCGSQRKRHRGALEGEGTLCVLLGLAICSAEQGIRVHIRLYRSLKIWRDFYCSKTKLEHYKSLLLTVSVPYCLQWLAFTHISFSSTLLRPYLYFIIPIFTVSYAK